MPNRPQGRGLSSLVRATRGWYFLRAGWGPLVEPADIRSLDSAVEYVVLYYVWFTLYCFIMIHSVISWVASHGVRDLVRGHLRVQGDPAPAGGQGRGELPGAVAINSCLACSVGTTKSVDSKSQWV